MKLIKYKNELLAKVFFITDVLESTPQNQRPTIIKQIVSQFPEEYKQYGLDLTQERFLDDFDDGIFSKAGSTARLDANMVNRQKVIRELRKIIVDCKCALPSPHTNIFIFPRVSKRAPVSGNCIIPGFIQLFLNTESSYWINKFRRGFAHEFFHSEYPKPKQKRKLSVRELMTDEGLAMNFSNDINKSVDYADYRFCSIQKAKKFLIKNQSELKSISQRQIDAFFAGRGRFVNGAGHIMGFILVKEFLKANPNLRWEEIVSISRIEIFKQSWKLLFK